jgi:4-hydroxy-tetrahydrodipicolinate synthase
LKPQGLFVPNITPFSLSGEIMFDAFERLIEYWIKSGVSGIVVNASTGEGPYLSRDERKKIIEFIKDQTSNQIEVYAGTGSMSTWETIEFTKDAIEYGAEAALITTPFFFKTQDYEIKHYFIDVINAVDIPVILYNVPKFTGYNINPKIVEEITKECSGLAAIKDSSGNPGNMAELIRLCGDKINCLSGSADMILPTLMLGGKGAIVAIGNIVPSQSTNILEAYKKKDLETAGKYQQIASYVNKVLVKDYPQIAAIKTALNQKGFNAGVPRKPLMRLSSDNEKAIFKAMKII